MIINSLENIAETERDVPWGNGNSRRLLIQKDNMGYSLTDTVINAGTESLLEYKNHLEACYCIEGEGEVVDTTTGETHKITPGTMYALDKHEAHWLKASKTMRLVCVFNPPLRGDERHSLGGGSSAY
ncbi:ectoine synthase [uncultured Roseobacter sp.]|uniref:ectoine synthase n=1 Tax=uncultured Roseobacter sp. TaxID=114847 RepID=UPI00262E75BE|nr:ectoine synthase [uncultured Roseobacter sp.]